MVYCSQYLFFTLSLFFKVTFVILVIDNSRPKTPQVCCFFSRQDVQRLSIESSGKTLLSDFDVSFQHLSLMR